MPHRGVDHTLEARAVPVEDPFSQELHLKHEAHQNMNPTLGEGGDMTSNQYHCFLFQTFAMSLRFIIYTLFFLRFIIYTLFFPGSSVRLEVLNIAFDVFLVKGENHPF